MRNSEGILRRYDIVVTSPDKQVIGIEVKSGSGVRTPQQISIDKELVNSGGFDTVGQKAMDAGVDHISDVKVLSVDEFGNITIK